MKITAITAFAQWQPFVDGTYTCSGGRSAAGFDSTIVRIATDEGITGWGEYAPLGSFYDPAFVGGAREGLRLLAPLLIGANPCATGALNRLMDLHLNGHPYANSAAATVAPGILRLGSDENGSSATAFSAAIAAIEVGVIALHHFLEARLDVVL